MKTFTFDAHGNLSVRTVTIVDDGDGNEVEQFSQADHSPEQLAVHLPMYVGEMSPEELLQAQVIIKAL